MYCCLVSVRSSFLPSFFCFFVFLVLVLFRSTCSPCFVFPCFLSLVGHLLYFCWLHVALCCFVVCVDFSSCHSERLARVFVTRFLSLPTTLVSPLLSASMSGSYSCSLVLGHCPCWRYATSCFLFVFSACCAVCLCRGGVFLRGGHVVSAWSMSSLSAFCFDAERCFRPCNASCSSSIGLSSCLLSCLGAWLRACSPVCHVCTCLLVLRLRGLGPVLINGSSAASWLRQPGWLSCTPPLYLCCFPWLPKSAANDVLQRGLTVRQPIGEFVKGWMTLKHALMELSRWVAITTNGSASKNPLNVSC